MDRFGRFATREAVAVAELKIRPGQPRLLLIAIEVSANPDRDAYVDLLVIFGAVTGSCNVPVPVADNLSNPDS